MRNPWLCLCIVLSLALGALTGLVGIIVLSLHQIEPPPALISACGFCWGSLSAFLVQPPKGSIGGDQQKPDNA